MSVAAREAELLLDGLFFPEGPRWRDGRLYVSDFFGKHVLAVAPDGSAETVCAVPQQPSGIGFTPDGDMLVVSMLDRRLLRVAPGRGEATEYADLSGHVEYECNDLLVDAAGRAYVGNFGCFVDREPIKPTMLLRADPDGQVSVAAEDLVFPNGMVIDDGTFVVAESFAYRVSAFDLAADGTLSNRRIWADFGDGPSTDVGEVIASGRVVPDGICLDAEGALWIADANGSGALRVLEGGEVLDRVSLGDMTAFAVALGGDDGRTLFCCAGPPLGQIDPSSEQRGALMTCQVDVPAA